MISTAATVLAWRASLERADGGGVRAQAVVDALARLDVEARVVQVGPPAGDRDVTEGRLGMLKRQFLPVPLRSRVERELPSGTQATRSVSLLSATHRWAIDHHAWSWIDYPDLWSAYAANPTADRLPGARLVSNRQAALWRRREREEARAADVVTTASWIDARELGGTWLPTPVWRGPLPRRDRAAGRKVAGLLANFDYPPNRAALKRLQQVWAPELARAGYEVVIAGFGSAGLGDALVRSLGPVDSVDDFYAEVDLVLAPVESGGGMKVKVIEALSRGVPVLADEHAVDGLPPSFRPAVTVWGVDVTALPLADPRSLVGDELDVFSRESFERTVSALWSRPSPTPR